jgi:hypothetical protein
MAVQYIASTDPTLGGSTLKHEGRRQTGRRSVYAGSRLKLIDVSGRSRLTSQPSSRTGVNPPYGMIGRVEETSGIRIPVRASILPDCERDGWGRLSCHVRCTPGWMKRPCFLTSGVVHCSEFLDSDDGPGHYNPDPSEGPWGGGDPTINGGAQSSPLARHRAGRSMRPRGARRAEANRTSTSACREQA